MAYVRPSEDSEAGRESHWLDDTASEVSDSEHYYNRRSSYDEV